MCCGRADAAAFTSATRLLTTGFNPRIGHSHHAVAGDNGGELLLAPVLGAGGAPGEDEIAQVGEAVVNAHDRVVRKLGAEFDDARSEFVEKVYLLDEAADGFGVGVESFARGVLGVVPVG